MVNIPNHKTTLTPAGYRRILRKLFKVYREWKENPMQTPRMRKLYSNWPAHYSILAFDECSYIIIDEVRRKYMSSNMEPVQNENI